MKEWLKANGGPPALIVTGFGLITFNQYVGIVMVVIGVILWIQKSSWFPFTIAKKKEVAVKRSDSEIVLQARAVVKSIGALLGQHIRYKPAFHAENDEDMTSHAAWARGVNRSNNHDQSTAARFFEDHYENLMQVVSALHNRGALTQDEVQRINWQLGTTTLGGGLAHQLADIPPMIAEAADRLESGKLPGANT